LKTPVASEARRVDYHRKSWNGLSRWPRIKQIRDFNI